MCSFGWPPKFHLIMLLDFRTYLFPYLFILFLTLFCVWAFGISFYILFFLTDSLILYRDFTRLHLSFLCVSWKVILEFTGLWDRQGFKVLHNLCHITLEGKKLQGTFLPYSHTCTSAVVLLSFLHRFAF